MSHEINLEIGVKATPEKIFKALTDTKQLARWWTSDTRGKGTKVGELLEFWFGDFCMEFRVKKLKSKELVEWKNTKGMSEWLPTSIKFSILPGNKQTIIRFKHSGWKRNSGRLPHCAMRWAMFMLSLKDLLEKGKGHPVPHDVPVNHD